MINEINELSLSQNGSLSAKDLRLFLLKIFIIRNTFYHAIRERVCLKMILNTLLN